MVTVRTVNLFLWQFDGNNLHITGTWHFDCFVCVCVCVCGSTVLLRINKYEDGTKQGEFNHNNYVVRISSSQECITKFYEFDIVWTLYHSAIYL